MSVSARVLDIQSRIEEHHEVTGLEFVTIVCDSCGRMKTVYTSDLPLVDKVFSGWIIGTRRPYQDYCPGCA